MDFKEPDRIPLIDQEGFVEETIRLWCGQGFPGLATTSGRKTGKT